MLAHPQKAASSQISVLRDNDRWRLYCCHTLPARDMAGNPHVLSVGVDLAPALSSNADDGAQIAEAIGTDCMRKGGQARIARDCTDAIRAVASILSVAWIEDALQHPAHIICPRTSRCPRGGVCNSNASARARDISDVRHEILQTASSSIAKRGPPSHRI
jgi:hypothetical protein